MRRAIVAVALAVFLVAGATTVAAQEEHNESVEDPVNETEEEIEAPVNETEDEVTEAERGESAQFDARLMTAINTVEVLVEIAPDEESEQALQDVLDSLEEVQENTDTASLGPEGTPREVPEDAGEQDGAEEEPEEADSGEEAEEAGEETPEEDEQQGPPEDRGPEENENRPGFVNRMLGGIFG